MENRLDPWLIDFDRDVPDDAANIRHEIINDFQFLDGQLGAFPKKTIPDALRAEFLQPAGVDIPIHSYAVLDAACVGGLVETLENSGLEHLCLFDGEAYDRLRDAAPWLVRLEAESSFMRRIFTTSDNSLYLPDRYPGVFIRSAGSLDKMRRHLRKFTRIRDRAEKWYYFRFWTHAAMDHYLGYAEAQKMMAPHILSIISIDGGQCHIWRNLDFGSDRDGKHNSAPTIDRQASAHDYALYYMRRFAAERGIEFSVDQDILRNYNFSSLSRTDLKIMVLLYGYFKTAEPYDPAAFPSLKLGASADEALRKLMFFKRNGISL